MTPQQKRLIRPLTRQHPAAQAVLTVGAISLTPLLALCRFVCDYSETFCAVMAPEGYKPCR